MSISYAVVFSGCFGSGTFFDCLSAVTTLSSVFLSFLDAVESPDAGALAEVSEESLELDESALEDESALPDESALLEESAEFASD